MIVSHEHKFIFVKTRKTAGTSIEVALSAIAGDDAIVTPVTPPEPDHRPRNWQGRFNPLPELFDRYVKREPSLEHWTARATFTNLKGRRHYYNHVPASVIRARLGRKIWDDYFTFCFERDPWEKVVSWYFYVSRDNPDRCRSTSGRSPATSRRTGTSTRSEAGWPWTSSASSHSSERTSPERSTHVGITDLPELPRAKGQIRPTNAEATITPRVDERIREVFRHEIRHFGYTRPEPPIDVMSGTRRVSWHVPCRRVRSRNRRRTSRDSAASSSRIERRDDLVHHLDVLRKQSVRLDRLVVVDNAPSDENEALVTTYAAHAPVTYLRSPDNSGAGRRDCARSSRGAGRGVR